jgi:hypothetical protein
MRPKLLCAPSRKAKTVKGRKIVAAASVSEVAGAVVDKMVSKASTASPCSGPTTHAPIFAPKIGTRRCRNAAIPVARRNLPEESLRRPKDRPDLHHLATNASSNNLVATNAPSNLLHALPVSHNLHPRTSGRASAHQPQKPMRRRQH